MLLTIIFEMFVLSLVLDQDINPRIISKAFFGFSSITGGNGFLCLYHKINLREVTNDFLKKNIKVL
jgi:hypothetical protein